MTMQQYLNIIIFELRRCRILTFYDVHACYREDNPTSSFSYLNRNRFLFENRNRLVPAAVST